MKKLYHSLRLVLTLPIIACILAALLAVVNGITHDAIAAAVQAKTDNAIAQVLPSGGTKFYEPYFVDSTGLVKTVYAPGEGEKGDSETGEYAVEVTPSGFGGQITMMVGVDKSGKVLGISLISHTETAGLGAVAAADTENGKAFREQFVGLSGALTVGAGGQVDALTGATITSQAITDGVNAAVKCVMGIRARLDS